MKNRTMMVLALGAALAGFGCEREGERTGEIERQAEELRAARERAPQVEQELQQELADARQRVEELEEDLTLAQRGVTEDVVREREELREALEEREAEIAQRTEETSAMAEQHEHEAQIAREELHRGEHVTDEEATETPEVGERRVERQIGVERTEAEDWESPEATREEEREAPAEG